MSRRLLLTVVRLSLSIQQYHLPIATKARRAVLCNKSFFPSDSLMDNVNYSNKLANHFWRVLRVCVACTMFSFYSCLGIAQESFDGNDIAQLVEQLLAETEIEIDAQELSELFRYYQKHPIDLNKTDERELAKLYFLSPLQIASLLGHREQSGKFLSVLELQGVAHFDVATIERLSLFVTVSPSSGYEKFRFKRLFADSDQQVMLRYARVLQSQHGYEIRDTSRSRYLGDANRYMIRYRLNFEDKVRLGINMEKDAGEPFFGSRQPYGFDHYGISLSLKDLGFAKEVLIGNYAMQVGQGLVMWNGLSFGKGGMTTSSAKQGIGLRAYTSLNEYSYLTGLAARTALGQHWELTPFISWRKLSGNRTVTDEGNYTIRSISSSGLHRTPNELQNRKRIAQWAGGLDIRYKYKRFQVGAIGLFTYYNGAIVQGTAPRNAYDFQGDRSVNLGLNYQYTYKNVYLFGETAYAYGRGWATLNGLIASLHPKLSIFANYRNFQKDYSAPFAQSLGEGSSTTNEKAIYGGFTFHPNRKINWVNYIDIFQFPWWRYRVDGPSQGLDLLSQFTYTWYKRGSITLRFRHRLKEQNNAAQPPEREVVDVLKDQLRLAFQYKLSTHWEIRTKAEAVRYAKEAVVDYGWLAYQDVFWKLKRFPLQLNMRLAIFATDSYDARLYAYENDVLYASAFPMYNGRGGRGYLNLRYRASRKIDFWFRYSHSYYPAVETIGSGLDQSQGPTRSEVKIQMRYRW